MPLVCAAIRNIFTATALSSPGDCVRMRLVKRTAQQHRKQSDAWQAAADYGCDMALLERNLRMTQAQRVVAHNQALALVKALRQAKVVRRG